MDLRSDNVRGSSLASADVITTELEIMDSAVKTNKQDLRTARMRERILTATLDCIYELGFQKASTPEITCRAGVSRGALLHHFPTKEMLIASAVEKLLEAEIADIRRMADAYAREQLTIGDFIDNLWERFSGRLFMITMDFLSSARTDNSLRDALIPPTLSFHASLNEIWTQFFKYRDTSPEQVQVLLNTTLCLLRGMGVQTITREDSEYYESMIENWKTILQRSLDEHSRD